MKTIKAKQTIAGSYGVLSVDQTAEVTDKAANDLVKAGLAEIVSEGKSDTEEKNESSISISDNSNKEKRDVLVKDEKKSNAGPGSDIKDNTKKK